MPKEKVQKRGLSRDISFKKHKNTPTIPHKTRENETKQKTRKVYEFDEELNNLKARNGIFTNKKSKKPTVITLTPSILTEMRMKPPVDIHEDKSNEQTSHKMSLKPEEVNIFDSLQEPDPVSFKFQLQPSALSKFIPEATKPRIDDSEL